MVGSRMSHICAIKRIPRPKISEEDRNYDWGNEPTGHSAHLALRRECGTLSAAGAQFSRCPAMLVTWARIVVVARKVIDRQVKRCLLTSFSKRHEWRLE